MKKFALFISIIPLLLSGCSLNKFLKRPDDTNLEFWITESWSSEDFTKNDLTRYGLQCSVALFCMVQSDAGLYHSVGCNGLVGPQAQGLLYQPSASYVHDCGMRFLYYCGSRGL